MIQLIHLRRAGALLIGGFAFLTGLYAWQKPFKEYPGLEYTKFKIPPNPDEPTEWVFARLMYPPVPPRNGGVELYDNWKLGGSNWTMDYPRSDRHLSEAVRRLTRIHGRSAEEPNDLDDGDVYNRPWLYGVEVGHWQLTDSQAATMREYLLRGGFFMCDDFHGTVEWSFFEASMRKVFPDRPIVEIENSDSDLPHHLRSRRALPGSRRAISGDRIRSTRKTAKSRTGGPSMTTSGRIMVAMCFNMDLGDSWEHADNPEYPSRFSDLGIRTRVELHCLFHDALNMTH